MLTNLVQKKETFFDYKENIKNYNYINFNVTKIAFFQTG